MNKHEANKQLKQLMLQYEHGMIDYSEYRQRRNEIIDQYAGIEEFIPPQQSFVDSAKKTNSHKKASGISAAVTLLLVLAAALITFLAMNDTDEKKLTETFVDSSAAPLNDN